MFVVTPVALNASQLLLIYLHWFFGQNMIDLDEGSDLSGSDFVSAKYQKAITSHISHRTLLLT